MKQPLVTSLLAASLCAVMAFPASADQAEAGGPIHASHGLLSQLEKFLHDRELDAASLNVDSMVGVMVDWARFEPATGIAGTYALVFQYGGWSEGCATGFKFSPASMRLTPRGRSSRIARSSRRM